MVKKPILDGIELSQFKNQNENFVAKPRSKTESMVSIGQMINSSSARNTGLLKIEEKRNAALLKDAQKKGNLVEIIPLSEIKIDYLTRDRLELSREELEELKYSIAQNGQRHPVDLIKLADGYGLLSGYRRIQALKELSHETVRAFVKETKDAKHIYQDMIEENEIRANLSHYERGKLVCETVDENIFPDIETAVASLFVAASKSKRSKIRSFANVHRALGDILKFPMGISERLGLRLAQALTRGDLRHIRDALTSFSPKTTKEENDALRMALNASESNMKKEPDNGSSSKEPPVFDFIALKNGGSLKIATNHQGSQFMIDIPPLSDDKLQTILHEVQEIFEKE